MSGIYGEILTFPQRSGPDIRLRVFGNHDYSRYETVTGFTVVHDHDLGLFCYATESAYRLVSTGVPTDQPPPFSIVRHLSNTVKTIGSVRTNL